MGRKKVQPGDPQRCENCTHFFQHYLHRSWPKEEYVKASSGHCGIPHLRLVWADQVCDRFVKKDG